ncbi:hypothetical protein BKA61DRAFT_722307 [Leptodontidium sp. MPI-SDFR-AT-0119]|nr:hypothetical protein BKA61DRAFT_722307 [Leptodontidium sp. MPI-SDFR-AT-0119]
MSFVATPEQIRTFQEYSATPSFPPEAIVVDFVTTPEFIASVLPPGFEAQEQPTGHIMLSGMESKLCGEFDCAIVTIDVKYRGRPGTYMLEIIISGDSPVTWGREVWGECKKTGTCRLWRSGDYRYAYAERGSVRLVEIQGKFGDELPSQKREGFNYEIKAFPHSSGKGLQWEPRVNCVKVEEEDVRHSVGEGRLTIRGTVADPLHSIPIKSIGEFRYHSGRADYTVVEDSELGCGDAYVPYMIGRHYEDLRIFKIGAEWTQSKDNEQEPEMFSVQHLTTPGFK